MKELKQVYLHLEEAEALYQKNKDNGCKDPCNSILTTSCGGRTCEGCIYNTFPKYGNEARRVFMKKIELLELHE